MIHVPRRPKACLFFHPLSMILAGLKPSVAFFGRQLVMGNLFGALHALIPKIYLQATPRLGRAMPSTD